MIPQRLQNRQKRHTKNGKMASFHRFEQIYPQPFNTKNTNTSRYFRPFFTQIAFDECLIQITHRQAGNLSMPPDSHTIASQNGGGMQLDLSAGEETQMFSGVFTTCRLVKTLALDHHQRVTAQHQRMAGLLRHGLCLGPGQGESHGIGPDIHKGGFQRTFIHIGGLNVIGYARRRQHGPA